jgi:hypothetical protein
MARYRFCSYYFAADGLWEMFDFFQPVDSASSLQTQSEKADRLSSIASSRAWRFRRFFKKGREPRGGSGPAFHIRQFRPCSSIFALSPQHWKRGF